MGADEDLLAEEQDFFVRELNKMDFGDEVDVDEGPELAWGDGAQRLDGW